MCVGVSRTEGGVHGMKMWVGWVEMGSLCHPQASKWHPAVVSAALQPRSVSSNNELQEVGAVPEDELSHGDNKFSAVKMTPLKRVL